MGKRSLRSLPVMILRSFSGYTGKIRRLRLPMPHCFSFTEQKTTSPIIRVIKNRLKVRL